MSLLRNLLGKKTKIKFFTTPSHSGKLAITHKFYQFYKSDISETDFHNPQDALLNSEKNTSKIYGSKKTKYLTNGSTSGIIASVLACINKGEKVLIWKNSHPCHRNAVELAGGEIIEYDLPIIEDWGIPDKTTSCIIEEGLKQGAKAVIITSPSYYGVVSDIKTLTELCHKYNAYLIVDEAHGALYPFSDALPESAVKIADFTVQSLHKTAGGLNPTALLHTNTELDVDKALAKINTTSPSYPLLATIEENIHYLNSKKGRKKISELIKQISEFKQQCPNIEFFNGDPTKILIKKGELSGFELSEKLYSKFIEDEKANDTSVLLLTGLGTDYEKLKYLFGKLAKL